MPLSPMQHIVYCWQMGDGLGHIVPLAKLVRALRAQGYQVTCALKDTTHAPRLLGDIPGVRWLLAPRVIEREHRIAKTLNLADVLHNNAGFSNAATLASLLRAWQSMFTDLKPDRVICDFSPTAKLAALSMGLDVVCIDSGFSCPPLPQDENAPLPAFFPDQHADSGPLIVAEQRTLQQANLALREIGAPPLSTFSALFRGTVWYRNWMEFNHFGPHSRDRHLGQISGDIGGAPPDWPDNALPRVFAYLRPGHPHGIAVLKAALDCRFSVLAYLPGFSEAELAVLGGHPSFRISAVPLNLTQLPDNVEIGIWHSPTGAVAHSLSKGMRMIFLPLHPEQELACAALSRAGLPAYVIKKKRIADWRTVFEQVFSWPRVISRGHWLPAKVHDFAAKLVGGG